jgi:hypothetical protein
MRRPSFTMIAVVAAAALVPSLAAAQDSDAQCDRHRGPTQNLDCPSQNIYYTPPLGTVRATTSDMQVLAKAMQRDQVQRVEKRASARFGETAGIAARPRDCTGPVRVVYGGYGESGCATREVAATLSEERPFHSP